MIHFNNSTSFGKKTKKISYFSFSRYGTNFAKAGQFPALQDSIHMAEHDKRKKSSLKLLSE